MGARVSHTLGKQSATDLSPQTLKGHLQMRPFIANLLRNPSPLLSPSPFSLLSCLTQRY